LASPPGLFAHLLDHLSGMRLRARCGGWNREPFGGASQSHVSVYELIAAKPTPAPKSPARRSALRGPRK
jgi:hypothetical protein